MKIKFENGSEINTLDVKNDSKRGFIRRRRLTDKEYVQRTNSSGR